MTQSLQRISTPEHGRLAARVINQLINLLVDKPCEVYSSDVRIRIAATNLATYSDVSVVCHEVEHAADDADAIANPTVIVEVLSDPTEAYDRGEKWAHYQRIDSLKAYVLVSQKHPAVELFQRQEDGSWRYHRALAGERLALASLGGELEVDVLYRNNLATRG